ncbi:hypothetical protein ACWF7H_19585 [Peribacillus butanolivorans]|uniref:hypothetical protein n=1 Tax=Peribacillus butanolivorans TaxID=421767 RepID=UPI00367D0DD0
MPIDNPWIFDIDVPTEQLAATSITIQFNQEIQLGNGQSLCLDKMIVFQRYFIMTGQNDQTTLHLKL